MNEQRQDLDTLVTCLSECVGLPIDPAHFADVSLNLGRLLSEGRKVMRVGVSTDMEPAPVFRP